jgi:hypothetical protein
MWVWITLTDSEEWHDIVNKAMNLQVTRMDEIP